MKKHWAVLSVALLIAVPFVLWGCGGDDDPTDPPVEACSITVTTPVTGDAFVPGDPDNQTVRIRWDKSGDAARVSIELLKAGELVDVIAPNATNNGVYTWTASNMGAANGADFSVRVTALDEDNCLGVSGQFSLTNTVGCSLAFTNDFDHDITFVAGDNLTLTWYSNSTLGNVSIELWRGDDNTTPVGFITEAPLPDTGSYDWTIDSLNSGTYDFYTLKIIANGVDGCFAVSDTFGIADEDVCSINISSPQPDVVWTEGHTEEIDLIASDDVTAVNLRLYKGSEFLGNITYAVDGVLVADMPYSWVVSDFGNEVGNTVYRIRAISIDDQYCIGISEPFTIISTQ